MSKLTRFLSGTVFATVLLLGGTALPAHAAGLTSTQISAILGFLQSFGADQSVINNVQASLTGGTPTTSEQHKVTTAGISTNGGESSFCSASFSKSPVAVRQFQAKYGISQTGYVGPITLAKLNALYSCTSQTTQVVTTQSNITITSPKGGEIFYPGAKLTISLSGTESADQYKIELVPATATSGGYYLPILGTITGQTASLDIPTNVDTTQTTVKQGSFYDVSKKYIVRAIQLTKNGSSCVSWDTGITNHCAQIDSNIIAIGALNGG